MGSAVGARLASKLDELPGQLLQMFFFLKWFRGLGFSGPYLGFSVAYVFPFGASGFLVDCP